MKKMLIGILINIVLLQDSIYWDLGIKIDKTDERAQKDQLIDETINKQILELSKKLNIKTQKEKKKKTEEKKPKKPSLIFNKKEEKKESYYKSGTQLFKEQKYKESIEHFEKIDKTSYLKEEKTKINYLKANAYFQIGESKKAQELLEKIIEEKNTLGDNAYVLLGMIYKKEGQYKKALESFNKIIQKYPNSDFKEGAKIQERILTKKINEKK